MQVTAFNGTKLRNLEHLAWLVTKCTDAEFKFELNNSSPIVIDAHAARHSTAEVMTAHSIPHQMSRELRARSKRWTDEPPIKQASARARKASQINCRAGQQAAQRGRQVGMDTKEDIFEWDVDLQWPA